MKLFQRIRWGCWLVIAMAGCAKVEMMPEVKFPLLPLASGNRWVYVDSFFTSTTLPSTDTFVTEVSYLVSRPRWVDRFVKTERPGKTLQRLQGWELQNTIADVPEAVLSMGDTLVSDGYDYSLNTNQALNCRRIDVEVGRIPTYISTTGYAGLLARIYASPVVGDSLAYVPIFHNLGQCIPGLGPAAVDNVEYKIRFEPLVATDSLVNVTTEAGTFVCIDFGSQFWAEGVGMVQSYHEGETSFTDNQQVQRTGTIRWKRSLKSYQLY